MNQSGYLGIGANPKSTHHLYVNGKAYFEDAITLQTSSLAYDPVGLIFGSTSARIGADAVNLGLYATNNIYFWPLKWLNEANIPYSRLHDVGGAFGGKL